MTEPTTRDRQGTRRARRLVLLLAGAVALSGLAAGPASAMPSATRIAYAPQEIVPIPASVPHEEGDMVDRRIVANLRWLAQRFPIYVSDGYSGKLPGGGEHVGCRGCHVRGSDHHNGLAVDIVALNGSGGCDRGWRGITRLAKWAEPRQNQPRAPFRWVGYDGDAGHGCGHHLHLSWEHAVVPQFQLAEWVEVFTVRFQGIARKPQPQGKRGGTKPGSAPPRGPQGGVSVVQSVGGGGVLTMRPMRCPGLLATALAALLVLIAGCGNSDEATPVACLEGQRAYLIALDDAPGAVRLGGEAPISDCFAENQSGGDLAAVGTALIATATELNAAARTEPGGEASLQLGYLVGAAERGADRTEGIHADLIRRLKAAAHYSRAGEPLPPAFERGYGEGVDVGLADG